jgi:mycofactocin system glycosyltransferase
MTTLVFDPSARRLDGGRVLVGGHPARMLRLTPAGARMVDAWRAGEAIGPSEGARSLAERLIGAGLAHPRPPAGAVTPADVAVVIPARDRPEALAACLARVGPRRELVIVDDGSTDAIVAPPETRVVRRAVSGGPAAARNAGLAATEAPFVAFLDSDTLPTEGWLEPLLAHFGDPRLAAIAPRVRVPSGRSALARYEAARSPLDLGPAPGIVGPGRRVGYVPAAALVVRRAALASPFDEGMRFGEDVDLVWRLAAAGWTVRYEPASVVEHPHRATPSAWLRQRAAYGSSAGALARRHPGQLRHVVVPRDALLSWALALAGHPKLALLAALPADALRAAATATRRAAPATPRGPAPAGEHAWLPAGRDLAWFSLEARARTARQIADAAWRAHAPALAATRRGRRFLAGALLAGGAADYVTRRPRLDPVRFVALRAADDLAYVAGVWAGCTRARTVAPLIPAVQRRRTG